MCAQHRKRVVRFSLGCCHDTRKIPNTLTKYGIIQLAPRCLGLGILISLLPAWNGIVEWDCAVGLVWQCYPLFAPWVGDYPQQVMVAQIPHGLCLLCEVLQGALMGHSTFRLLDSSRDQHIHVELQMYSNIDSLHSVGVHPICNQFWQYPLCKVYQLWQSDELPQLLLGLVKDILKLLLKYVKSRNGKDQFVNWFTSVPWCRSLQRFFEPFDGWKIGTWQGIEMCGIIRTLAANWSAILVWFRDDAKIAAETASDELVMGAVWTSGQFTLHISQ